MPEKFSNRNVSKALSIKIRNRREALMLEIEDVAEMTGFHRNVIIAIENKGNPNISQLTEIAFALGLHPKDLLDFPLSIKSRYKLSVTRQEKSRLTSRIKQLINNGFFIKAKTSREVAEELGINFPFVKKIETKNVSVVLNRFSKLKNLKILKNSDQKSNFYISVK